MRGPSLNPRGGFEPDLRLLSEWLISRGMGMKRVERREEEEKESDGG